MALRIDTRTGGAHEIHPANDKTFTLKELQTIVGGYIEAVPLPSGEYLICNEDGKRLGLPVNPRASEVLHAAGGMPDDWVVGDVVIASLAEMSGDGPDE